MVDYTELEMKRMNDIHMKNLTPIEHTYEEGVCLYI